MKKAAKQEYRLSPELTVFAHRAIDAWRNMFGLTRYKIGISERPAPKGEYVFSEIYEDEMIVEMYFGDFGAPISMEMLATAVRDELMKVLIRSSNELAVVNTLADLLEIDDCVAWMVAIQQEEDEPIWGEEPVAEEEDKTKTKTNKRQVH